jgi:tRNA nucleotidyltransferase/poly(A) polymerase
MAMNSQFDSETELIFSALLEHADEQHHVYLVGGIVRDILLQQNIHDIDISYCGNVKDFARKVADTLCAKFFMLNEEYQTARIIYKTESNHKRWIDVIATRENIIEEDLFFRDFTVNSMAIDLVDRNKIIDPYGGAIDLQKKILKMTNPNSITDDPVRILRAIRLAVQFGWKISTETIQSVKNNSALLKLITNERKRDELFKILELPNPSIALRIMKQLKLLELCFPEISQISSTPSSDIQDQSINFVLEKIDKFVEIEELIILRKKQDAAMNIYQAELLVNLGGFRNELRDYFGGAIHQDRNLRSLFILGLIYSSADDFNKTQSNHGKRNLSNLIVHSQSINSSLSGLVLTNVEVKWINLFRNNIFLIQEAINNEDLSLPEFAFDFFNRSKNSGIAICFYALANQLNLSIKTSSTTIWKKHLFIVQQLLDAYFNHFNEWVEPPSYLNGHDIRKILKLKDGKLIGDHLRNIKNKIVKGEIKNRKEAIDFLISSCK